MLMFFDLLMPPVKSAQDHRRVSRACVNWLWEIIYPGHAESGMEGSHLASVGSMCVVSRTFRCSDPKPFLGAKLAEGCANEQNRHCHVSYFHVTCCIATVPAGTSFSRAAHASHRAWEHGESVSSLSSSECGQTLQCFLRSLTVLLV